MVPGDDELQEPSMLAIATSCLLRAGRRVVESRSTFEPPLEAIGILAQIVQQAGQPTPFGGTEPRGILARQFRDVLQMLSQALPPVLLGPAIRMGEVADGVQKRAPVQYHNQFARDVPVPDTASLQGLWRPVLDEVTATRNK